MLDVFFDPQKREKINKKMQEQEERMLEFERSKRDSAELRAKAAQDWEIKRQQMAEVGCGLSLSLPGCLRELSADPASSVCNSCSGRRRRAATRRPWSLRSCNATTRFVPARIARFLWRCSLTVCCVAWCACPQFNEIKDAQERKRKEDLELRRERARLNMQKKQVNVERCVSGCLASLQPLCWRLLADRAL